jgi:hypothetical protein
MLTSVPLSIDVTQTTQQIFMGDELLTIDTASDHIVYRYAVGGPNDASQVNFQLERAAATAVDAALGFYDPSGNLLTQVDASDSTPWSEQASQILETEAVHFLGVFFDQSVSPGDFELTVSQPTIPHAPSLPIDIGTGMLQYVASSDGDALNSPSDVEFYSLDLTNGGTSGTVMVQPLGIDGEIYAELLYREGSHQPYREIDSASDASGQAVSLTLTPSPGRSLAHGEYVLAVSTEGFDGAPGAFQIDVDASPVLVPGSLTNPTVDSSLASPAPIQLGASSTTASGGIDANDDVIYRIKTTNSGDVKLSVASSADIIASIYEEDGSGLLGVYQNPTLEPLNLAPDSAYLLRLSSETDASFDLTATTTFTPQDAPLSNQQFSDTFVAGADRACKPKRCETASHRRSQRLPFAHRVLVKRPFDFPAHRHFNQRWPDRHFCRRHEQSIDGRFASRSR